jgi:UDP-N-acetylglucosamine--N-acetylmuramyl-(pentapeptide) pyrophosphoryl-undecaprenol N-acetylglucosamine transferase
VSRAAARDTLGVPLDRFLIVVMGGSLGSGVLNEAIAEFLRAHADDSTLAVRQIAGERFVDAIDQVTGPDGGGVLHQIIGYDSDMASVYNACDLLIGRGGASTVHEVAVTGTPAILVPWAASADDHQTDNVAWLSEVGAAVMLRESGLEGLSPLIDELRGDAERRDRLGAAARARGEVHRSGALARLIERAALAS